MRMYDGNGVMVNEEDGCGANDATRRVRYLSPTNRMTIRFTSDYTVTKAGLRCTVRAGKIENKCMKDACHTLRYILVMFGT